MAPTPESILNARDPPSPFNDRLVRRTRNDSGAPFEPLILDRLADMPADGYERIRVRLRTRLISAAGRARRGGEADPRCARSRGATRSQIDRLHVITKPYECFRNEFERPFVSLEMTHPDGRKHTDTVGVRAKKLRDLLTFQYYSAYGRGPGDSALNVVINTLASRALYGGIIHRVGIRKLWHDGKLYLDIGNPDDRVVIEVDDIDWRLLDQPPPGVKFLRPLGTQPLPMPVRVSPKVALAKLEEVTRFQTPRDKVIVVGFILHCLGGKKPYAVLLIIGEPGASKTAHVIVIGSVVDPRATLKSGSSSTKRDLYISASTRALVIMNNVSSLSKEISDAGCTITEGGMEARRALFTDEEESGIYAEAPIIITAIRNVVEEGDLADRALRVELAAVPKNERMSESKFQAKLDAVAPIIMGGMLSALSEGIRRMPTLDLKELPRLAEFAAFATACETAFGWDEGTFLKAFDEAAATNADEILIGDPVTRTLQEFMEEQKGIGGEKTWTGTATDLLKELNALVRKPERVAEMALAMAKSAAGKRRNPDDEDDGDVQTVTQATIEFREERERVHSILDAKWPKAPNILSARLKLLGPQLKAARIHIKWPTGHKSGKLLTVVYAYISPGDINNNGLGSSSSSTRPPDVNNEHIPNSIEQKLKVDEDRSGDDAPSSSPSSLPQYRHNQTNRNLDPSISTDPADGARFDPGLQNKRKRTDL